VAQNVQSVSKTATTQQIPRYMYASCSSESPFGSGTRNYSMLARVHSSDGGCQWLSGRLAGSGFIAYARAEHSYIWVPDETCESPDVCRVGVMQRRHEGVKPLIYVCAG
jgi:hypothetical protein